MNRKKKLFLMLSISRRKEEKKTGNIQGVLCHMALPFRLFFLLFFSSVHVNCIVCAINIGVVGSTRSPHHTC